MRDEVLVASKVRYGCRTYPRHPTLASIRNRR